MQRVPGHLNSPLRPEIEILYLPFPAASVSYRAGTQGITNGNWREETHLGVDGI